MWLELEKIYLPNRDYDDFFIQNLVDSGKVSYTSIRPRSIISTTHWLRPARFNSGFEIKQINQRLGAITISSVKLAGVFHLPHWLNLLG